jgi:hypothetical protein
MPSFDVNTDIDIDIDIDDFVDACTTYEIKRLIEYLEEEGHIANRIDTNSTNKTFSEKDFEEKLTKIANNRFLLSDEELELIEKIANRF